jgi:hypothetical protein
MNQITVDKRNFRLNEISKRLEVSYVGSARFEKPHSVFRNFKDENEDTLRKMFDQDFNYSKINRVIRIPEELIVAKEFLWANYKKIKNVYLTCIVNSEYPIISWNDFTLMC